MLFVVPLLVGTVFFGITQGEQTCGTGHGWDWVGALWWAFATVTTVGYGDLEFGCKPLVQIFSIPYVLLSVVFAATAIENIFDLIATRRRQLHEQAMLDRLDLELIKKLDVDGGGVQLHEYLVGMLVLLGYVDQAVVDRFSKEFRELDLDNSGSLDARDLEILGAKLKKARAEDRATIIMGAKERQSCADTGGTTGGAAPTEQLEQAETLDEEESKESTRRGAV